MALLARNCRHPSGRAQLHSRRPRYFVPLVNLSGGLAHPRRDRRRPARKLHTWFERRSAYRSPKAGLPQSAKTASFRANTLNSFSTSASIHASTTRSAWTHPKRISSSGWKWTRATTHAPGASSKCARQFRASARKVSKETRRSTIRKTMHATCACRFANLQINSP